MAGSHSQKRKKTSRALPEHELKYVFNNHAVDCIVRWLSLRCRPDSRFPVNKISSIYYDTKNWQYLFEKINSDYLKTKVRLRWYSDYHTGIPIDTSFIEVKNKIGFTREKHRIQTDLSGTTLSGINLNNSILLDIPLRFQLFRFGIRNALYPTFQTDYTRRRFIEPTTGSRLCVDADINVPRVNMQMVPRINPLHLKSAVLELKGQSTRLPEVLHQLTSLGCRKQAFSKYSECYLMVMGALT